VGSVSSLTLWTGLSSADAVYAKVAARRAESAMLRMAEREEREKNGERKRQKKGDLIVSVYLQFCHVCHMSLPTPTRPSLRGQMQRAPAAVPTLFRSLSSVNRISYHKFIIQVF
jgi:hypothetical protein